MIIRTYPNDIDKVTHQILTTSKMSLAAKGLILYLLTEKSDDYELSIHDLCIAHCSGQSWLEKTICELQNFGYIDYELIKNSNGIIDGKFIPICFRDKFYQY